MFRVRVHKIESFKDADGNLGKRIELAEDREITPCPFSRLGKASEEAAAVNQVIQGLQTIMPVQMFPKSIPFPKILLFLTEDQCEALGVQFEVNQVFEVTLEEQSLKFKEETTK